jgi:3-hydroxybutyryl-CoA dehydrogenase
MQIVVKASPRQQKAFLSKTWPANSHIYWHGTDTLPERADAWFDLSCEEDGPAFASRTDTIVFANAVLLTNVSLPEHYVRINAWQGFLERPVIEIAATAHLPAVQAIMDRLNWTFTVAPDEPGMIAARIIAMIINEAYFALGEEVSSKTDIDTAMKLGTNYPYGPFEWCEKIGIQPIYHLLTLLAEEDERYQPAPALAKEFAEHKTTA